MDKQQIELELLTQMVGAFVSLAEDVRIIRKAMMEEREEEPPVWDEDD